MSWHGIMAWDELDFQTRLADLLDWTIVLGDLTKDTRRQEDLGLAWQVSPRLRFPIHHLSADFMPDSTLGFLRFLRLGRAYKFWILLPI